MGETGSWSGPLHFCILAAPLAETQDEGLLHHSRVPNIQLGRVCIKYWLYG